MTAHAARLLGYYLTDAIVPLWPAPAGFTARLPEYGWRVNYWVFRVYRPLWREGKYTSAGLRHQCGYRASLDPCVVNTYHQDPEFYHEFYCPTCGWQPSAEFRIE